MNKDKEPSGSVHIILSSTKYKMFNFMVSIVLLLILSAVLEGVKYGYYVINIASNVVFLLGVYATGRNKKTIDAIADAIFIKPGDVFRDRDMINTYRHLKELRTFRYPNIEVKRRI